MRKRSLAREIALQALYQLEVRGNEAEIDVINLCQARTNHPEIQEFARDLIKSVQEKQTELDNNISKMLDNWNLNRLAILDRIILRMATYEMMYCDDIPPIVAINEAVDLAKKYSTKESGSFVNGILDKIYQAQTKTHLNKFE